MSGHAPQAVLFDLDGTLVDSALDLGGAVDEMRHLRGLERLGAEHYRPLCGAGARGLLKLAFGLTPESAEYEGMKEEFFNRYEQMLTQRTQVFEGVGETLASLRLLGLSWGVVTNKSERFALPLTAHFEVFKTAGVVICGDTTAHAKPHPAPLLEAAKRLGLSPQSCWYVGDDLRDIQAAQAAGMVSVAATYGYMGELSDVHSWGADHCIDSPLSLFKCLALT
jgi:N-acetyl-D-muramate 6-phosphate phosphatase